MAMKMRLSVETYQLRHYEIEVPEHIADEIKARFADTSAGIGIEDMKEFSKELIDALEKATPTSEEVIYFDYITDAEEIEEE